MHQRAWLLVTICVFLGCATSEGELTGGEWVGVQTLAVVPGPEPTEVRFWVLDAGTGAGVGALRAMEVATALTAGLWPLAFYGVGAVCVPLVGAGVGAVVGAIEAPPNEEEARIQGILFDVITPECLPQVIQVDVLGEGGLRSHERSFVSLDAIEGEDAIARAPELRERGIDAVLEITIESIEVSGPWGTSPMGAFQMGVRYELIDTRDSSVLLTGYHAEHATAEEIGNWWMAPTEFDPEPTSALSEKLYWAAKATAQVIADAVYGEEPHSQPPLGDAGSAPVEGP